MPEQQNNDVGGIWIRIGERDGKKYLSISLKLARLLDLTGGETPERLNLTAFKNDSDSRTEKSPDYHIKYYPPRGAETSSRRATGAPPRPGPAQTARREPPRAERNLLDDDIPFVWLLPLALGVLSLWS